MKITKKGHIYKPDGTKAWSQSHAQVPFAYQLNESTIRIFYATRDNNSCSSTGYIDVNANNPTEILNIADEKVFSKGTQGEFDDSGTMPSWFLENEGKIWLYYTAWNKSKEASYRLSIGLAESNDNGEHFKRVFKGPLLDRNINDPIWVGQPCVLKENGIWKMWYLCCEKIEVLENHPEPFYNVKYATSKDGVNWVRENNICIDFDFGNTDAIGRPCVWKHNETYYMFHSNRQANGYRDEVNASYRIELSKSVDGVNWEKDERFELLKSGDKDDWDGMMNEYTSVLPTPNKDEFYVFYNGNGFGASGFGYFILNMKS